MTESLKNEVETSNLLKRFEAFIGEFVLKEEDLPLDGFPGQTYHVTSMEHPEDERWNFDPTMCNGSFSDFNRNVIEPGFVVPENEDRDTPERAELAAFIKDNGIFYVRMDDDFFVVASLPYEYGTLSIQDVVATVWPNAVDPVFNPDSGDVEAWRKIWADPEHPTMVQLKGPAIKH